MIYACWWFRGFCGFAGFLIMLPVAVCFGEVFTFEGQEEEGFLARDELHTPKYMFVNLFAGECVRVGCYLYHMDRSVSR